MSCRIRIYALFASLWAAAALASAFAQAEGQGHRIFCPAPDFRDKLVIHQLYVGQGDSAFIRTPSGTTVLIDGGDVGVGSNVILPTLRQCYGSAVTKIDYLILTHPHRDHFGGLREVMASGQYPIGAVIAGSGRLERGESGSQYRAFLDQAQALIPQGTQVMIPSGIGANRIVDPQVSFEIVAADGQVKGRRAPVRELFTPDGVFNIDDNGASLALMISFGKFKFFTAGDLTGNRPDIETAVAGAVGPVDVYKSSHHGSDTSNRPALMRALRPVNVLVSVGSGGMNGAYHLPRRQAFVDMSAAPSVLNIFTTSRGMSLDILPVGDFSAFPKTRNFGGEVGTDLIVTTDQMGDRYAISWLNENGSVGMQTFLSTQKPR